MQYIVIARDGEDCLEKRLSVREKHVAMGDIMRERGEAIFGVALLDEDNQMKGSVYIVDFDSRKELDEWLQNEPYVQAGVWQDIEIVPCKVGPSFLEPSH